VVASYQCGAPHITMGRVARFVNRPREPLHFVWASRFHFAKRFLRSTIETSI
jgi:hypothetical protein